MCTHSRKWGQHEQKSQSLLFSRPSCTDSLTLCHTAVIPSPLQHIPHNHINKAQVLTFTFMHFTFTKTSTARNVFILTHIILDIIQNDHNTLLNRTLLIWFSLKQKNKYCWGKTTEAALPTNWSSLIYYRNYIKAFNLIGWDI